MIADVLVLGGGSAGLLAALSLRSRLPDLRVRVVHSPEIGPSTVTDLDLLNPMRSIFQLEGFYTLLLGQKVPHRRQHDATPAERQAWAAHCARFADLAARGLSIRESLDVVRSPYWSWTPGFYQV